jgi:hypothetical protein
MCSRLLLLKPQLLCRVQLLLPLPLVAVLLLGAEIAGAARGASIIAGGNRYATLDA